MIVVDSTAVLALLFNPRTEAEISDALLEDPSEELLAPTQLDQDILKALSHYLEEGDIIPEQAQDLVEDLKKLRITRHPLDLDQAFGDPKVMGLMRDLNAEAVPYLLLALKQKGSKLLTCDPRLKDVAERLKENRDV